MPLRIKLNFYIKQNLMNHKSFLTACICLASINSMACNMPYEDVLPEITRNIKNNGGFNIKNYDYVCKKLEKEGLRLLISGDSVKSNGIISAWSLVYLIDKDGFISYYYGGGNTLIRSGTTPKEEEKLLNEAINNSIDSMDIDGAVAAFKEKRSDMVKNISDKKRITKAN